MSGLSAVEQAMSMFGVPYDEDGWQSRALCAETDPEAFFPEKGGSPAQAKKMCEMCEVREECLEAALANDERFGVWGALTLRERERLQRSRGRPGGT